MAHPRQLIRQAVRTLLDGVTVAGARVSATRVDVPYRKVDLPAISVYTLEETVEDESSSTAPRELERELTLEIAGFVEFGEGVDDRMDDLAQEIETAMHADPFLGGLAGDCLLVATELSVRGEGDRLAGVVTLTYAVTYRTLAPEPPADDDMDDFLRVDAEHNPAGEVHPDEVAEDLFTVQEEP
jgi:hypothetical protein